MAAPKPSTRPNVFNIPASAPFLPVLIRALRDGRLIEGFPDRGDPLSLGRATIYLPTRRACRLARDIFLDITGDSAAILPRIVPLGDIDEDELIFAEMLGPRMVADSGEWGTYAWGEFVLGVPGMRVAGGTDEVMRNIVGERVLGLPREPR